MPLLPTPGEAAEWLGRGHLLIYPTETFYALGCAANRPEAIREIYAIKGRDPKKPLPVLADSLANLKKIVEIDENALLLGRHFWPGPLSLLCAAKAEAVPYLKNPRGKTGVRLTSCAAAAEMARELGFPIVSTSANLAGEAPALAASQLSQGFLRRCAMSGGKIALAGWPMLNVVGLPSTFVDFMPGGEIVILREGQITAAMLRQAGFQLAAPENPGF